VKAALLLLLATALVAPAQAPNYEIYGIRYATLKDFPVSSLVAGADKARRMDLAMYVWLIKGGGHTILFDAGFYREQFMKRWKPVDYTKPSEAIARAGLKPEDITDVVLSHIHWDHADGADLFPKAKVWIQKAEYTYYTADAWQQSTRRGAGADADDVLSLVTLNTQGRLALIDGDAQEFLPGLTAYIGGKHTYQSQFITVHTAPGAVVLASDNAYLYENLEKHLAIGQTLDAESNLRAQTRMAQLAFSLRLILPGHDPMVMDKFPAASPGVVRIQ
jgi:glyoxylase-like metal-dependent hydrolase (beta-lactamase superfamily II)